jgi:hypothetical protein
VKLARRQKDDENTDAGTNGGVGLKQRVSARCCSGVISSRAHCRSVLSDCGQAAWGGGALPGDAGERGHRNWKCAVFPEAAAPGESHNLGVLLISLA